MKVLKFGGTSVGSAININKVISILEDNSKDQNMAVVVSAVGGITDKLIDAGRLAVHKDEAYESVFEVIQNTHIDLVKSLIPHGNDNIITVIEA